jgi:hypothetical protein
MQPLLCKGGYPMPITNGKHEIVAINATISNTAAVSRLTLIDSDDFKIVADSEAGNYSKNRRTILDLKGIANDGGNLTMVFPEPLKTTRGINISSLSTNTVGGKVFVYVR